MLLADIRLHRSLQMVLREGTKHCASFGVLCPGTFNILSGSIIVAMYAWVEENTGTNWRALHNSHQQKPFRWISWDEFLNLHKIRHCFAHSMEGILLPDYATAIISFCHDISLGRIFKRDSRGNKKIVKPYYSIDGDKIKLLEGAVQRCMEITVAYWSKVSGNPL